MKKAIKTISLLILLLIVVSLPQTYAQPAANSDFASALNKITNDYPNEFNNLKGKIFSDNQLGKAWECTEHLPGYEDAMISTIAHFKGATWNTTIIKTNDSTEAFNKYREISEKINLMHFDCCSLTKEESSRKSMSETKETEWTVESVISGKDNKFSGMSLRLDLTYPTFLSDEYKVTLTIE